MRDTSTFEKKTVARVRTRARDHSGACDPVLAVGTDYPAQADAYELPEFVPVPRKMVAVIDASKIGHAWVLAVRDPLEGETVYAREFSAETTFAYQTARNDLYTRGFEFSTVVSDGRFVALPWLFPNVPIQMCDFHQQQIRIRYLTLNPKLEAGIELLDLVRTLPKTDEASFNDAFKLWCRTWHEFLQEKTMIRRLTGGTGRTSGCGKLTIDRRAPANPFHISKIS